MISDRLDKLLENPGEWTLADMPDLSRKTAIVSGANGGLGKALVLELVKQHCKVIMVCRDKDKGDQAIQEIKALCPEAELVNEQADFANLVSVYQLTERLLRQHENVSLIFNNAGVMDLPLTIGEEDGFDATFKTNYLAHFLLTCRLLPLLQENARIIFTGSTHHQYAKIDFDDIQSMTTHTDRIPYYNSKWMLMSFCMELHERLKEANATIQSLAAHPGFTATNILTSTTGKDPWFLRQVGFYAITAIMGQKPENGILPLLYAATGLNAQGGHYYGPDGVMEYNGNTQKTQCIASVYDRTEALKLWTESEMLIQIALAKYLGAKFSVPEMVATKEHVLKLQP